MTATLSRSLAASMRRRSPAVVGLCPLDAALMVTSGFIHLHLQRTA